MNSFLKILWDDSLYFPRNKEFYSVGSGFSFASSAAAAVPTSMPQARPSWAMVCAPDTGTPRSRQRPSSGRISRGSASQARNTRPARPAPTGPLHLFQAHHLVFG